MLRCFFSWQSSMPNCIFKSIVLFCSFKFEVRQNMLQISNSLQRERHFCFDANPYPTGRRGLRRKRNVWRATSSELSHFKLESTFLNNPDSIFGATNVGQKPLLN